MRKVVLTVVALAFGVTTAAAQNPVSDSIRSSWNEIKRDIKESAEQMPEANYTFKPTPEVRSFGAILAHVAGASYVFCASAKGEKSPVAEGDFEKTATTKAAIVKAIELDGRDRSLEKGLARGSVANRADRTAL
jgi:hypothetical protein